MASTTEGNEFLGDEDLTGKEKDAPAMVQVMQKLVVKVRERYGQEMAALVTDNPTVMRNARTEMQRKHPCMIIMSCLLHGLSKLLEDLCNLPSIAELIEVYKSPHFGAFGGL